MGTVWSAVSTGPAGFAKLVAIKTLLGELTEDLQYGRALRDEAQLAASLSHPNLCEVTELGEQDGQPFLVMEWVDGASLSELLGGGRSGAPPSAIEPDLAARVAADACAGLHALHEARDPAGVALSAVHRDVSPQNILLTRRGEVKLSDLGVAKARGQLRAKTRSGELRGKLGYLAPEQLSDGRADRRSDVHAVGCVLYLCLVGELPYPPNVDSFGRILAGDHVPIARAAPGVPADLAEIVARALKTRPGERYPSARDLRRALEGWRRATGADPASDEVSSTLESRLGPRIERRNREIADALRGVLGGDALCPAPGQAPRSSV